MTINYKGNLLAGFGASLLILAISSVASFVSIQNLLSSAEKVNETHQKILKTEAMVSSLREAESGQRGFLLTNDMRYLENYESARNQVLESLRSIEEAAVGDAAQQRTVEELKAVVGTRLDTLQQVIDFKESSGVISVERLDNGRIYMANARELITKIGERELELLVVRSERMNAFSTFTPMLIVAAALIALVLTTAFYIRIKNDLNQRLKLQRELEEKDVETSRRIKIIRDIADKIALGDYAVRADDKQRDALGNVADSLNTMAVSLQRSFGLLSEKEWLQAGMASLNDVIIGEKNVAELSKGIIDFVCQYVNGHVGALYILDQDILTLQSGFALVPDRQRDSLHVGEGLIGQAVGAGRALELKDIPPQSMIIKFSSGEALPGHIVAIPIYDGVAIKGGIEVASIANFSPLEIEFLKSCAHNIGIAISTAQNRRKLQELLEETQAQTEELQAQHSELETQAERLQASEEELRAQQEELRMINHDLEERSALLEERNEIISERNMQIQMKAEELAQSARYKSEFLANMSHELRTPLNSILLLSRLMSDNVEQNLTSDQVEYARVIEVSGKGLLMLIDEILDLSKLESGKMELNYQQVPVQDIVSEIKALFAPVAREKGLEFQTSIAPAVPELIEIDRMRLEQVIRNLLSNAIKFTAEGYVSLNVMRHPQDEGRLCFVVRDSGIGISAEKHQLIFDAFQQADGSTQRKYGGTGLGLSISRELVKLLGGEITLVSETDKGSEFTVSVPLRQGQIIQQLESTVMPSASELDATINISGGKKYLSAHIPENIPDDRENIVAGDKVILIVEDDTNFAASLLEYTRSCGYKGLVSVRGDDGIALAKRYSPLGILLDIQLPVKSGWEVMEELKADASTRHIPVHIMSSHEAKHESLLQGAVDFIDKPVAFEKMQDIFKKIEYVLTQHPKKVLIVEENSRHAQALAYFLKTFDVKLDLKSHVDEAISALQSDDVDCIVLDMGIPDANAYRTLEEIKRTPGLENVPVIVFTGSSLSQKEEVRIKAYADSIVIKTAHSYQRILDEVSLFLHLMEKRSGTEPATGGRRKLRALDEVLTGKTVLIADDDARNIFSLTKALESFQINVITAIDGKDALAKLADNPQVDIILMDMMMPAMDGYQSMEVIRKNPETADIPIIAVTAKAMMGDRDKCIQAGASDYITKPVDIDQLLSLLRVWLYERG